MSQHEQPLRRPSTHGTEEMGIAARRNPSPAGSAAACVLLRIQRLHALAMKERPVVAQ